MIKRLLKRLTTRTAYLVLDDQMEYVGIYRSEAAAKEAIDDTLFVLHVTNPNLEIRYRVYKVRY